MGARFIALAALAVAIALYAGAFSVLNGNAVASSRDLVVRGSDTNGAAGETLDLMIWNLGYGGLGRESDFIADGGTHYFPPSRAAVRGNVEAIERFVSDEGAGAQVVLFQEIARGGPVNYWVDLKSSIDQALHGRDSVFFADFKTRLMPWPLAMTHGQAIYSTYRIESADVVALPAEDASIFGVKRRYASVVARIPIDGAAHGWTVASVHLAAFDPDAAVRTRQLRELLAWAEREYQSGQHIVIGGDWNFQLAETTFPNTTEDRFLFWLFPFPQDALPGGWRIAADARVPSVRTNHQPYVAGENYVTTIDGFIVSPNVAVESVAGFDLGFQNTDHQPVRARMRALRAPQTEQSER
ncbi:endonuclease/exonuclease/phosphatase family protein [Terricaulis silvestris]|uniref:Endonuclease/Exonuclease/phosphatase family protein n=1 Tax=Terricaulis silvestris TaxID=2686094 RepID=A0A6I6MGG4_9CAUL|nr:endonuclease/exonuclease/phosphatase family protein [Terricaulis silvestris]QGZ93359.1 Endonuclease/Exonuclease/phosphatase family protein [Terricaulis silvestris]